MKKHLPNLLLVLATATAALSAASARRPWREVLVQPGVDTEEFLAFDIGLGAAGEFTRGLRLDADLASRLDMLGIHTVKVRNPAQPVVRVPLSEASGEVLAEVVVLAGQTETLRSGRIVGEALLARAEDAGVHLAVDGAGENARLAQDVVLPAVLRESTFLDDKTRARLQEAGVVMVPVKRAAPFTWGDWAGRWTFVLSALALLAAVLMKRASRASSTEASEGSSDLAGLRRELAALAAGTEELAGHAGSLDAEAIHAELDPLIGGPAYAFVEGREILQASAGMATYALVMDPFSRGERQLARAWSASVDGHAEEARASLARAVPLLHTAAAAFPS